MAYVKWKCFNRVQFVYVSVDKLMRWPGKENVLTLHEKIDILEFRKISAEKCNVSETQTMDIATNGDALYKTWTKNGAEQRKWDNTTENGRNLQRLTKKC